MRVLIAEDNENKLTSIIKLVEELGFEYDIATNYDSAQKIISIKSFNFILLDMTLPETNLVDSPLITLAGVDLVEQMDFDGLHIPTIIITGYDRFGRYDESVTLQELKQELLDDFPEIVKSIVYYDGYSQDWKEEIINFIGA